MRMDVVCNFCILLVNCNLVDSQSLEQSKTLTSDILAGYDIRQRPVLDQSQPINVTVDFDLLLIQDFEEVKEKFSVTGILLISWRDESLVWDPVRYGGIQSQMFKLSDVWYPTLVLGSPYDAMEYVGDDWMAVRVFSNGAAYFSPAGVFKSACIVDVTYYPFDTQSCELMFIPWGYISEEMKLICTRPDVLQTYFTTNGEWNLVSTTAENYNLGFVDSIVFTFNIRRKPTFLVINVILPIIFMSFVNLLVFMLPVESGERVSYATTVLLSLAVFLTLVGDNMPKTSEPMSILCYYLTFVLVTSTLICVVTILNLKTFYKKDSKIESWCVSMTTALTNKKKCCCNKEKSAQESPAVNILEKGENATMGSSDKDMCACVDSVITWMDVSIAVDRIALISFALTLVTTTSIFLYILINNTPLSF